MRMIERHCECKHSANAITNVKQKSMPGPSAWGLFASFKLRTDLIESDGIRIGFTAKC